MSSPRRTRNDEQVWSINNLIMIFKTRKILTVGIFLAVFAMSFLLGAGVVRAATKPVNTSIWSAQALWNGLVSGFTFSGAKNATLNTAGAVVTKYSEFDLNPLHYLDGSYNNQDTQDDSVRQLGNSIQTQTANITKLENQLANGKNVMTEEAKAALQKEIDKQKGLLAQTNQAQNKSNNALGKAVSQTTSTGLLDLLGLAVSYVLYGIAYGLGTILMLVTKVMLMVAVFNNFVNIAPVVIGWTITRDVCNNFFIILMIAMAIGTTLKVQNYQWHTMLPKVLFAAILINFSKMLTGLMIDASQVIMLTFAAPLATLTGYNIILASFGLPSLAQLTNVTSQITDGSGNPITPQIAWVDIFAALIFAIVVTIAALVVIIAIAGILVYRIIMFWFLIILSPLWIFGKAFNQLGSITGQWEGEIKKYLITGPVMMFFLYLSFMAMATFGANNGSTTNSNYLGVGNEAAGGTDIKAVSSLTLTESGQDSSTNLSNMASPNGLINVMVVIGLLWGSLLMGSRLGGAGKIAGDAQGWMKKFTGLNIAKKVPAFVGTAVDDKLGLRSKLYGAAYQVGGKFVPGLNVALGSKIGALESGTSKREQAKIDASAVAFGMSRMSQAQLRAKANSIGGSTAQKMAATQALLKNGWIKDDDEANSANNTKLIDFYRSQLPQDLKNTFDNNLKKSNPNLALKSSIYGKGTDVAKLTADIQDGKVKLADLMKEADAVTLKALGGGNADDLMKYLVKNSKDDKEFGTVMAGLSKAAKDMLSDDVSGVKSTHFESTLAAGTTAYKDEQKKLDKMRDAYIHSAKDFRFDKIFGASEEEKRDNYVSANQSFIAAEIGAGKLDKLMDHVGHVFDPHALEQIQKRGSEFETKLKEAFNKIATNIQEADLDGTSSPDLAVATKNKERARKTMENALLAHSEVKNDTEGRRDAMKEILTGKNKSKVLDSLAEENINADFLRSAVKAGLSDTDYKKLNKKKVKDGFKDLTSLVDGANANDDAKIYEQALINGATVEHGSTASEAQKKAMKAALSGSKRADVLKNISHENIDDDFIENHLGSLSAKEVKDLGRASVDHKEKLNLGLSKAFNRTKELSGMSTPTIRKSDEKRATELMFQMASAGTEIELNNNHANQDVFRKSVGKFSADTLKNINLGDDPSANKLHIEAIAMNMPFKALKAFLGSTENRKVATAIVDKLIEFKGSTDSDKLSRSKLFSDIL